MLKNCCDDVGEDTKPAVQVLAESGAVQQILITLNFLLRLVVNPVNKYTFVY